MFMCRPDKAGFCRGSALPTNVIGERLVLTGDDDDFDNTVYVLQPRPEHVSVLFAGDEAENDSTQPFFYLERAFQPTPREVVEVAARTSSAELSPADLAEHGCWWRQTICRTTGLAHFRNSWMEAERFCLR